MEVQIVEMEKEMINEVALLEKECFSHPWSRKVFEEEVGAKYKYYYAALAEGEVVGYCGMMHVVNEGHVTNVAVKREFRRQGVGEKMMGKLFEKAKELEMIGLTLEVRMSNEAAQKLYTKMGFKFEGLRKGYYQDSEDAMIMWKYFEV